MTQAGGEGGGGGGGPPSDEPGAGEWAVVPQIGMPAAAEPPGPGPQVDADLPALAAAPPSVTSADLVDAVGARVPRKERKRRDRELDKLADAAAAGELDEDELDPAARAERRGRRRTMVVLAVSIAVGLLIVAFVILGRLNKDRYFVACGTTEIRAEQGRGFPPWGSSPLDGAEWRPIAIPANAECHAHEVDDLGALTGEYLAALVEQAQVRLTAKDVTEVDVAAKQLEQALLLARDPARRDARKDIERLLGDVEYWRATARLRAAIDTLGDAAKQFDAAAERKPHHVGDAAAWAELARRAAAALGAGPTGQAAAPVVPGTPAHVAPPFGVALPVETPDAAPAEVPASPPDAGLPEGGVLL